MNKRKQQNKKRLDKRQRALQTRKNGTPDELMKSKYTTAVPRVYGGFGRRELIRFHYSALTNPGAITTGTVTSYLFRMNSLFDPDGTAAGHQPLYFDQLTQSGSGPFNRYRVFMFTYRIEFLPQTTKYGALVVPTVGLYTINSAATYDAAAEQPLAKSLILPASGANSKVINGHVQLPDFYGASHEQYMSDDRFQALISASPSAVLSLYLGFNNVDATTVTPNFKVDLFYYAELFESLPPAQSTFKVTEAEKEFILKLRMRGE